MDYISACQSVPLEHTWQGTLYVQASKRHVAHACGVMDRCLTMPSASDGTAPYRVPTAPGFDTYHPLCDYIPVLPQHPPCFRSLDAICDCIKLALESDDWGVCISPRSGSHSRSKYATLHVSIRLQLSLKCACRYYFPRGTCEPVNAIKQHWRHVPRSLAYLPLQGHTSNTLGFEAPPSLPGHETYVSLLELASTPVLHAWSGQVAAFRDTI